MTFIRKLLNLSQSNLAIRMFQSVKKFSKYVHVYIITELKFALKTDL